MDGYIPLTKPMENSNNITPKEIIKLTDVDFRRLPKTKERIIGYRGIPKRYESDKNYFQKYSNLLNIKKGDIVYMPEYAFFAKDFNTADRYMPGWGGDIMIEEHFPEGAQFSFWSDEFAIRRGSLARCKGVEAVKGKDKDYTKIILEYILPD